MSFFIKIYLPNTSLKKAMMVSKTINNHNELINLSWKRKCFFKKLYPVYTINSLSNNGECDNNRLWYLTKEELNNFKNIIKSIYEMIRDTIIIEGKWTGEKTIKEMNIALYDFISLIDKQELEQAIKYVIRGN